MGGPGSAGTPISSKGCHPRIKASSTTSAAIKLAKASAARPALPQPPPPAAPRRPRFRLWKCCDSCDCPDSSAGSRGEPSQLSQAVAGFRGSAVGMAAPCMSARSLYPFPPSPRGPGWRLGRLGGCAVQQGRIDLDGAALADQLHPCAASESTGISSACRSPPACECHWRGPLSTTRVREAFPPLPSGIDRSASGRASPAFAASRDRVKGAGSAWAL